jgi:SAM-dependent methyltransferase
VPPTPHFDRTVEDIGQLASSILDGRPLDRWPYTSGAACLEPRAAAQFVRQHVDLLRLARVDIRGRRVLEAGCGLGFALLLCALLGAERAEGIEFDAEAARAVDRYLASMPDDIAARVKVRQGDAAHMPYPDRSFDVLLSIEAISHYLDVSSFLAEAARVLRPGGVLIISDGNNGSNPIVRRRTEDIWEAFEHAPPGTQVHGHTVRTNYEDHRAEAILSAFPDLGEKAREIARCTAGFTGTQAVDAAAAFLEDGEMPRTPYRHGDLAIAPVGMAMERLFKPRAFARGLERYGFRAKALGYWGGASGRWYLRVANRVLSALSPITMPTAPGFRIVARRL